MFLYFFFNLSKLFSNLKIEFPKVPIKKNIQYNITYKEYFNPHRKSSVNYLVTYILYKTDLSLPIHFLNTIFNNNINYFY